MHAKDIADEINRQFNKALNRDTVSSMIYRYIKSGKYFKKTREANTFGLIEWPSDRSSPDIEA